MTKKRRVNVADMPVCSPIVEMASEDDRIWFEQHPGANFRIRRIVVGEFYDRVTNPNATVVVEQVRPGFRIRRVRT